MGREVDVVTGQDDSVGRKGPTTTPTPQSIIDTPCCAGGKIIDFQITTATDEVTISDLDINEHGGYEIVIDLVQGTSDDDYVMMYVNTDYLNSNYYSRRGCKWSFADPRISKHSGTIDDMGRFQIFLSRIPSKNRSVANIVYANRSNGSRTVGWWHEDTVDTNITQLKFSAKNGKDIFGVYTRFRIYAKG